MKTFEEFLTESDHYQYSEVMLTEANYTSSHRRTATEMASVHKAVLTKNNHTIINHETTGNGSHVITHMTPKKKVRVTTIKPVHMGPHKSEIQDRPGTPDEQAKYGPKN